MNKNGLLMGTAKIRANKKTEIDRPLVKLVTFLKKLPKTS